MNAPKLRFADDQKPYTSNPINDLVKISGGATPLKANKDYWENGSIPWLSSQEIGLRFVSEGTYTITELAITENTTRMVEKGTVLMVTRSGILARKVPLSISNNDLAINQDIKALIPKTSHLSSPYLYYWLKKNEFVLLSKIVKSGTTVQSINLPDLEKLVLSYPNIEVQQKVTDYFTLIDRRIEQQQEKVESWRAYKKSMMQKLFSRELRFKDEDGREFPEWATPKLEKLSIITMGQSPNGEAYSDNPGNVVLIQGNADMKNGFVVPRVYTSEITKMCDIGDIIMSVRAPVGALAKSGIAACIGRGVCSIKANDYIYHYLFYFNEIEGWEKLSQGSTFESVNSTDIKSLEIPTPSSIEQEKIADYLSSLDKKIEYEGQKLELFREQKKGFMQQMFI